ncbi:MAG: DegT/DnrJ/EryC1/StrS family aminotransferase, partial [Deltaproteobacteria bacterium]|nr:DegT/DnrJ/EryC1/StrS family aminotransferase [Deltaproteobacteria bacterium]
MIPLARPTLGQEETDAVAEVLSTGMLVQGERVARFEAGLSDRTRRAHAVAVSSGTAALELALEALGIGAGDEVLVPAFTWPSPAHAVRRRGATPILVDVDPDEWNASAAAFDAARTEATKAAIAIDQFGAPARHHEIAEALGDLPVIEDAACAIGASLTGRPAGAFGRMACLSFHPRKVLTTGEGGAVVTDDPDLADRIRTLRNHGQASPGKFTEAGGNHRLTEIQGALGLVQLTRLDSMIARRRHLAGRYRGALRGLPLRWQRAAPGAEGNAQTFGLVLDEDAPMTRNALLEHLKEAGIGAGILSYALHRLDTVNPADDEAYPVTSSLIDQGFAVPLHATLTDAELDRVVDA